MGVQLFTNGASSTLSGTLSQGGTTMTLAAGTGSKFPSITGSDFFLVTLFTKDVGGVEQNIEVVKVTARVGDTLTIVRDFENITGQSGGFAYDGVSTTVYVHLRWTAASAGGMLQKSGNLSGLADVAAARAALGLVTTAQGEVSLALSPTLTLVLDGTTDNGPIINAMLAAGWDTVDIPDSAAGCKISTQVILTTGKALRGVPGRSRVINGCDAVPMVVFRGSDAAVSDLNIECSLSNTSDVFRLDTATTGMERVTLQNVLTTNGYGGLSDNGGANYAINLRMERAHFRFHRGPGVTTTKAYGFTEINNTLVDRIGTATAANHPGFSFSGFQGISLDNCEVTGTKAIVSGTNSSQTGFVFSNGQVVFAHKCFADTCGGVGLSFSTVDYVRPTICTASLCDGIGMSFSSCNHVEATNLTVGGRNGTGAGNFTASIDGLSFSNCSNVALSTVAARNCTGNGITKSGTSQVFAVTSYVLTANTGRGLVDSSSGAAVFSGGVCSGNTAGNVSLASALQAIYATQVSSGGFLNAQAGPYTG